MIPLNTDALREQPLVSHLLELRNRVLKSILMIGLVFLPMIPFAQDIYTVFAGPLLQHMPEDSQLIAINPVSPFFIPFKLVLVLAFFVAVPFTLYQVWAFVAPGLYTHEKRMIAPLLFSSTFLFYLGAVFAYHVVLPLVFIFVLTFAPEGVAVMPDISEYLDFVLTMFFAFGVAFEIPIATIVAVWIGVTTPEALIAKRPYVIVGVFVLGMMLTPPDIISQTLLAVPMWLLFELGVIFSRFYVRKDKKAAPSDASDYTPPTDAEIEQALDVEDDECSVPQSATEKLELAKQFIHDQNYASAEVMLREVVAEGSLEEQALATSLLETLR